ncbi:MAG: hypothetical protein IBJ10_09340 [Phycisphaerales bacterium]|nr:hypothetical protein [Phycisphaerales bacterium]
MAARSRAPIGLFIAAAVALVGAWLAYRALTPGSPRSSAIEHASPRSDAPGGNAEGPHHPADLPPWRQLKFRDLPNSEALASIAERLDADDAWAHTDLTTRDREALRERALARIAYVLGGSVEGHRAQAAAQGAIRLDPPEGLQEQSIMHLSKWPDVWRDAPIDPDRIVVRSIDLSSDDAYTRSLTSIVSRSALSAEYPAWRKDAAMEVIEVVVPVRPRDTRDPSRRVPAFLGVSFERPSAGGEWRPRRISVYQDRQPGVNQPVIPPPT